MAWFYGNDDKTVAVIVVAAGEVELEGIRCRA